MILHSDDLIVSKHLLLKLFDLVSHFDGFLKLILLLKNAELSNEEVDILIASLSLAKELSSDGFRACKTYVSLFELTSFAVFLSKDFHQGQCS